MGAVGRRQWLGVVVVVAVVVVLAGLVSAGSRAAAGPVTARPVTASDISWPQCGQAYPAPPAFGIVGVNDGRPFTANPCLVSEYRWARAAGNVQLYMNTANPGVAVGAAYEYGFAAARDAYTGATAQVSAGPGHLWWLDVETGNSWSSDPAANTLVIGGSLAFFESRGVAVGIYSTKYQWGVITGGARLPSVANWVPGAADAAEAPSFCNPQRSFSGGPVVMVQYTTDFDYDYPCPAWGGVLAAPVLPTPDPGIRNLVDALVGWLSWLTSKA